MTTNAIHKIVQSLINDPRTNLDTTLVATMLKHSNKIIGIPDSRKR